MTTSFNTLLQNLRQAVQTFGPEAAEQKRDCLKMMSHKTLPASGMLTTYHDLLLFLCAYPSDPTTLALAEKELARIARFLRTNPTAQGPRFNNTGLPHTRIQGRFSHDLIRWMSPRADCRVELESFGKSGLSLNDVLRITLPGVEREQTSAGLSNQDLLNALGVKKEGVLRFLLQQMDTLQQTPYVKDYLFDGLDLQVSFQPLTRGFSRAWNRLPATPVYYHHNILKKFDHNTLMNTPLPPPATLAPHEQQRLLQVIRDSLTLTTRETDPSTFTDEGSLRLYSLERGVSVAIYSLTSPRQQALESYVGYTLFKNGFPAAYGGGWVFGRRMLFGINIFEAFRGGESGYLMCQLLRVYRQAFGVDYIEVEPYQYGRDNPEGIASGAFWFYYRYGFRHRDKALARLAETEAAKIRADKRYRSGKTILRRFTEGTIALNFANGIPLDVPSVTGKITRLTARHHNGHRAAAAEACVADFLKKCAPANLQLNPDQARALQEIALMAAVLKVTDKDQLQLMLDMARTKPTDLYRYQELLLRFLGNR